MTIRRDDYLQRLADEGIATVSNQHTANLCAAGPYSAVGLYPLDGVFDIGQHGGIIDTIKATCPPPSPTLRNQFNVSILPENPEPDNTPPLLFSLSPQPENAPMNIELGVLHDGVVMLASDEPLPHIVKRVEFYREQRLFMLVYNDRDMQNEEKNELMHYEVPENLTYSVEKSPNIIIYSLFPDEEPVGYRVPLIKVGDLF